MDAIKTGFNLLGHAHVDVRHQRNNKPASLLVVSLGKTLNGITSNCGVVRQEAGIELNSTTVVGVP